MTADGSGASPADPILLRLFLEEIERHESALESDEADTRRQAIHALKGSAGLAGATALSEALGRLERRIATRDASALSEARAVIADAKRALAGGHSVKSSEWPSPPRDLGVRAIDPKLEHRYCAEMADRLERIDRALAGELADVPTAAAIYREVHAMKGAALAVGDELTAWFCHGMEDKLRPGEQSETAARRAQSELIKLRGVLGELIVAPEHALEMLRTPVPRVLALVDPPESEPPLPPPSRRSPDSMEPEPRSGGDPTLRVPTLTLDTLFESVRQLDQARAPIGEGALLAYTMAARTRQLHGSLAEALRLIGPPRPWGAPAAAIRRIDAAAREIGTLGDALDREATRLRETAGDVREEAASALGALAAIRTTSVYWLFERVSAAITAQIRREGREVRVAIAGADTPIDRRVAELLVDPILQLARNAVAHGIEPAVERALRGKPRVGTIRFDAEPRGGGLRLRIHDDGAGVDIADVRSRAVASGTISPEVAAATDDQTLLALLFVPGFTTRDSADLLAGRGVGLDLALEAVRRLGGTIRLTSRRGAGLTATLDVPLEHGLVKVLRLEASGQTYAIPVQHTRRIVLGRDVERRVVSLDACLRSRGPALSASGSHPFVVELIPRRDGAAAPLLGVDLVGAIEEVAVRAISPVVSIAGPYAGAVVWGGELRLFLDAHALAELVASVQTED